jgi:large subunit ribosomal protein L23
MIKQILITEKTSQLNERNCYVFLVNENTNKIKLKQFISNKYNVKVSKVNMLKKLGKKVRRGRVSGFTQTFKKAYVFTEERIAILEGGN